MTTTLRTARLLLTPHAEPDLDAMAAIWADARTTEHIGGRPLTREETWRNLQRHVGHWAMFGWGYLAVRDAGTGALLGEVGLMDSRRDTAPSFEGVPEAGWAFAPAAWGKGYAREAVAALLAWADARGMERTVCLIDPVNAPSVRLAEALGYQAAGEVAYRGAASLLFERARVLPRGNNAA